MWTTTGSLPVNFFSIVLAFSNHLSGCGGGGGGGGDGFVFV